MERAAFKDIMIKYFIPHVINRRRKIEEERETLKKMVDEGSKCRKVKRRLEELSEISNRAVLVVTVTSQDMILKRLKYCVRQILISLLSPLIQVISSNLWILD